MSQQSQAIFKTLIYADLFDYPLTESQINSFLISTKRIASKKINQELAALVKKDRIKQKGSYYFLPGRDKIVEQRQKRQGYSQTKLKVAQRMGKWLKLVPSLKMVAVTGSLAMNNSLEADDIDLLLVTSRNRLWLSRFLAIVLLELLGCRRRPGQSGRKVKNKLCLNLFLDLANLEVLKKDQDLYTAHEVAQVRPLWDRDSTYNQFVFQNLWVKKYLANWSN